MKKRTWQVWTEKENGEFIVEFEGSHAKALQYYKQNGGSKAGLHIGYDCGD